MERLFAVEDLTGSGSDYANALMTRQQDCPRGWQNFGGNYRNWFFGVLRHFVLAGLSHSELYAINSGNSYFQGMEFQEDTISRGRMGDSTPLDVFL